MGGAPLELLLPSLFLSLGGGYAVLFPGIRVPGLMVWLFMGPYLALTGWAAALLGMATNVRLIGAVDGPLAPATQAG